MSTSIILLLLLGGAVLIPAFGGGDDDDNDEERDNRNQVQGTFGDDIPLNGTDGDDLIFGYTGNDTINAGAGVDTVIGGEGDDTINGGDNRDVLEGRPGDDIINGDGGNDTILGGAGNDTLNGGYGSDIIRGGRGDDEISGGFGAREVGGELVDATDRTDTIRGEGGSDTLYLWGGGGLASGGFDDDENAIADEKDTLVLVTGEGTLRDDQGTTDFYVLANTEDEIDTFATITEFDNGNPLDPTDTGEHRLILTVDIEIEGVTAVPQVGFEATESTIVEDGETVNGILIQAKLLNPGDFPGAEFEESSAFFRGETVPTTADVQTFIENNYEIEVLWTDAAANDYFDPETTVAGLSTTVGAHPNMV